VLLAPCPDDGIDEGVMAVMKVASKRSRHGGGGGGERVPAQRRRQRRGPGNGNVRSSRFLDGGPVAAASEGNKKLPSDLSRKAGPKFIVSSISSGSTWNHC
jgi:hypothetical protein